MSGHLAQSGSPPAGVAESLATGPRHGSLSRAINLHLTRSCGTSATPEMGSSPMTTKTAWGCRSGKCWRLSSLKGAFRATCVSCGSGSDHRELVRQLSWRADHPVLSSVKCNKLGERATNKRTAVFVSQGCAARGRGHEGGDNEESFARCGSFGCRKFSRAGTRANAGARKGSARSTTC